ncbi:aminotransferase class I/II-fold pyridoxal phosphate-dependent enzyme [bacterium]|nr:aminotransferase class I/II-fold pyridoxal phosphate-dependent enzyme [bacterium]
MANTNQKKGTDLLYALLAQAREYPDVIVMGRGDPDFDTPPHIVAAAGKAMQQNANDDSPPEGILPLRQAIAERVKQYNHFEVDPETEVVVTNGGQEALFLMVLAAVGVGEELLTPDPNYNTYNDALRFAGGTSVPVSTRPETNFRIDPALMAAAITDKTRAMLLVSPNNPAASVIAPDDVRALVNLAVDRDLLILSDEIYDRFVYDDFVHTSPASIPGGKERTLTLNALSKAFSMTGWRVGWITGPADLMAQVKHLKAATSGPNSIISQHAGLAALTGPQEPVEMMLNAYKARRRMVMDALDAMDISYATPQGGQFIFADISFTGMNSLELAKLILEEEHVLAYPGSAFGPSWENSLRITFLQPEDKLKEGLDRMQRAMTKILGVKG